MWKAMVSAVGETAVDERLGLPPGRARQEVQLRALRAAGDEADDVQHAGDPHAADAGRAGGGGGRQRPTRRAPARPAAPITKLGMPKGAPNSAAPTAPGATAVDRDGGGTTFGDGARGRQAGRCCTRTRRAA